MPHGLHADMWMFEYRYMRMFMSGMLRGKDKIDPLSVLHNPEFTKLPFPASADCKTATDPCLLTNVGDKMTMDMHMFMAMYHQTRDLSWMVMFNYLSNNMDMLQQMNSGMPVTTSQMGSSGIGDVQLFVTNRLRETDWFDIDLTLGINLPLGTIDAKNGMPMMGTEGIARYDMQMGSGTYDVITALNFTGAYYRLEYDFEIYKNSRTGFNTQYYNMGDILRLKASGKYTFPIGTQIRTGLTETITAPVEGRDERHGYNPRYTGGKRLDLVVGLGQRYKDYGVYMDYAYPLLQFLNGVQMKTTGTLTFGLEYMYM